MMSDNTTTTTTRYPFTPSQWQELEHQALIFKYMASGHPIPSDLILSIRRSLLLDPSPTTLFPLHPNIGWGCYQVGYGRKVEDPEPGRCRRTDGKKWRCSKEAHPDSKYCERHMHRGKNRSRKPVETNTNTTITNTNTNNHSSLPYGLSQQNHHLSMPTSDPHATFYPYSRNQAINFQLESGGSSGTTDKDFRFFHGLREEVDQYERDKYSWRFTPLGMSSLGEPKQRPIPQSDCYINPTPKDLSKDCENEEEKHKIQQPHCFVLGADLQRSVRDQDEEESQRPLRRFFDEWPKTQLSISTPMSYHDFSMSQSHTG